MVDCGQWYILFVYDWQGKPDHTNPTRLPSSIRTYMFMLYIIRNVYMATKSCSVCCLKPVCPERHTCIWKTFVTCGYCHVVGTVGWYENYTLVRFGTFKSKGSHMFSLDLNSSLFALAGSFIQSSYLANIICHFLSASLWSLVGSLVRLRPRASAEGLRQCVPCTIHNYWRICQIRQSWEPHFKCMKQQVETIWTLRATKVTHATVDGTV
jgi:hypothetical protein